MAKEKKTNSIDLSLAKETCMSMISCAADTLITVLFWMIIYKKDLV